MHPHRGSFCRPNRPFRDGRCSAARQSSASAWPARYASSSPRSTTAALAVALGVAVARSPVRTASRAARSTIAVPAAPCRFVRSAGSPSRSRSAADLGPRLPAEPLGARSVVEDQDGAERGYPYQRRQEQRVVAVRDRVIGATAGPATAVDAEHDESEPAEQVEREQAPRVRVVGTDASPSPAMSARTWYRPNAANGMVTGTRYSRVSPGRMLAGARRVRRVAAALADAHVERQLPQALRARGCGPVDQGALGRGRRTTRSTTGGRRGGPAPRRGGPRCPPRSAPVRWRARDLERDVDVAVGAGADERDVHDARAGPRRVADAQVDAERAVGPGRGREGGAHVAGARAGHGEFAAGDELQQLPGGPAGAGDLQPVVPGFADGAPRLAVRPSAPAGAAGSRPAAVHTGR